MTRILVGYLTEMETSGIDRYLLRMLENLWGESLEIDFLTLHKTQEMETKLAPYHSRLYQISSLKHPIRQYRETKRILKEGKYDAVYLNFSVAINSVGAWAAKGAKTPKVILHSHSSYVDEEKRLVRWICIVLHSCMRLFLGCLGTDFVACSQKAGEWMFTQKVRQSDRYQVIHNTVNVDRFLYDEEVRKEVRKQLGVEDKLVIGHVGHYCYAKNNFFLLDIMKEVCQRRSDAVLLAVGTGEDWEAVKEKAKQMGLADRILFLGVRHDVNRLMQAMDIFVLPSRFEGQPIVALEAQIAGLKVILSDRLTRESALGEACVWESIDHGGQRWADRILESWPYERISIQKYADVMKEYSQEEQCRKLRLLLEGK